ncbi:DUF1853 family protein [Oceanisphaera avium]|uniref:DUF1853 domain-containing protein n=1 Tax=Oceanisphaera avium TaxID=1903694 RepID=A0A1Y0CXF7_9GAMM|nr:DUF1853 family protein [Oceanisphaera avium]ART79525.1 hypothetical protein CBP12_04640 [Oceanisphaera avium]
MNTALASVLSQLNDPMVRDLAWALASSNLISTCALAPSQPWYDTLLLDYQPRLQALDKAPHLLHQHCAQPTRLGFYFEALWHFFLIDSPRFQVLAHNWQQIFAGTTVGAFDFLVWDRQSQRIEHWELAVKFYLISQPQQPFDHAFGLNTRDKLRRKYHHMLEQQLQLSQHPQVALRLEQQQLMPSQQRLILKGRLYYPLNCHQFISPDSERGSWGTSPPAAHFIAQQKLGWLTGHRPSEQVAPRQNYCDSHGQWYMQVDAAWLTSTQS